MDIYALKEDARGAYHDALDAANGEPTGSKKRRAHIIQARAYQKLMQLCEGWGGKQGPEEYLKREILALSGRESNAVYKAIQALGYSLK